MTESKLTSEFGFSRDEDVNERRANYFRSGAGENIDKIRSLMRFMGRQDVAKFCVYHNIFNMTSNVTGSIVECGVYQGNSLMTWANLSAALEPYNYNCKIIGLDTFSGYPNISEQDITNAKSSEQKKIGGWYSNSFEDLNESISIFDLDRPLNQIPKVELVKGDITETAPQYIEKNPHLLVRVLSITTNIYEPIKSSIKAFLPRMPKGSVLIIDSLNSNLYPGASLALIEELDLAHLKFETPSYYCNLNYCVM